MIVDEEVNRQRLVEDRNYELKLQQGEINLEIAKVFNNKTTRDDLEATTTIASNNKYIQSVTKPNDNIALSNARIQVHEKKQGDVNIALLMILCLAEAFILFSLLSKYIFRENADKNLLVFNSVKEELSNMISSFWETTTKDFIKNSIAELNQLKAQNQATYPSPSANNINAFYSQTDPKLLGNYSAYTGGYNTLEKNNGKRPQYNGIDANLYPINFRTSTANLPTVYGIKEKPSTSQIHGRISEKESKKQPFEIKEIFDENNEKWLYYKNWMVEENACSERSLSSRIGSPLENGFTQNDLKVKEIKTFELPISIDSDEHKKIWVIKIEEINKQYSNKGFVEAEMVEEVEKKNVNPNNKLFKYVARAELHHQEWQEK